MNAVALADEAQDLLILNDGHCTNAVADEQRRNFANPGVAADRYDLLGHDLLRFHDRPPWELREIGAGIDNYKHRAEHLDFDHTPGGAFCLGWFMVPSCQTLARLDWHIAELQRCIAEQRDRHGNESFGSAEILYLLEVTLKSMQMRKASFRHSAIDAVADVRLGTGQWSREAD